MEATNPKNKALITKVYNEESVLKLFDKLREEISFRDDEAHPWLLDAIEDFKNSFKLPKLD